jgi:chaperone modulatory protein CbpM
MTTKTLTGVIVEESAELSVGELCRACSVHAEWVLELVEEGVLEPSGRDPRDWRFEGASLRRARTVRRLQRDLGLNLAGAALALELLEELDELRARVRALQSRAG